MAYISFWVFDIGMLGLMLTPWLPLPALKNLNPYQRLQWMIEIWVVAYCLIAFTFEIPWLLFHESIALAEDELWAYPWWAYINGGDTRYKDPDFLVLFAESWACLNAIMCSIALHRWFKSGRKSILSVHFLIFGAVMHISLTVLYYCSEIFGGFPSVNVDSFHNFWAKFIVSNSFWVIMPVFVCLWGTQAIRQIYQSNS
jgi:hypothetical protein